MNSKSKKVVMSMLALGGLVMFVALGYAGNLNPSGPPGQTMKRLDEVEPRTPIQSLSGDTAAQYVIAERGAYYLTEDVIVADVNKHGIRVAVDNVTIDLMGYVLAGPGEPNSIANGISMYGRSNVEIRNGTIRDFGTYGIYDSSGRGHRVTGVRAVFNGEGGIVLKGAWHLVSGCTASSNGESSKNTVYGIHTHDWGASTVTGNVVCLNGGAADANLYGIYAGGGCTVTDNTVAENGNYAKGDAWGIYANMGSTIKDNTVSANGSQVSGTAYGIEAGKGCTVADNTVYNNGYETEGTVYGIHADVACTVARNTAYYNGQPSATAHGIYLETQCLAIENTVFGNNGTNMNDPAGGCQYHNCAP